MKEGIKLKLKFSKEADLRHEKVSSLLFWLALPALLSQVVNALYNMVDRMYIGHIPGVGASALTGLGVAFPLIMLISAFAYLFGMGGAPLASIAMGKGKQDEAENILGNCFILLLASAIVLTITTLVFNEQLLYLFGASANTITYAKDYMEIYALGTIFVVLTLGLNNFISAQGFSMISMFTVCIGALSNIILDPIFIYLFDMGVRGAALATILSQALSAFFALWFLLSKHTTLKLKKAYFKLRSSLVFSSIALGIAPFIMQATESALVLCFNSSLLKYGGDIAVGAMTILSSLMQFTLLPLQGLTQGSQPIISFNYGAKNASRVKECFKFVLMTCLGYTFLAWLLIIFAPNIPISIFTSDSALSSYTVWAIRIYMAGVFLMGAQIACQQTFVAFGNSKISAFLAAFRKIILLIPLIYILPNFFEDKVMAIFLAEPLADTLAVLVTVTLFAKSFKELLKEMES